MAIICSELVRGILEDSATIRYCNVGFFHVFVILRGTQAPIEFTDVAHYVYRQGRLKPHSTRPYTAHAEMKFTFVVPALLP